MNRWTCVELNKHVQEDGATSIHALKVLQFGIMERFLIMSHVYLMTQEAPQFVVAS